MARRSSSAETIPKVARITAPLATKVELPREQWSIVRAFGTEYVHVKTADGGDLWLTEHGWPWREHLAPERWFESGSCSTRGVRLQYSTGHVYRLEVAIGTRRLKFVAKLSRVAQRVSSAGLIEARADPRTSFPSPFEELGQLNLLRKSPAARHYLFTKRPLAIFSPAARVPVWMLDRIPHEFSLASRRIAADTLQNAGAEGVRMEADRDYYTLFAWIHGHNLQELRKSGQLSPQEMQHIDEEVRARLRLVGFSVADHKPDHVIVRLDASGAPRRRHGRLVAAIADFELLEALPTRDHEPEGRHEAEAMMTLPEQGAPAY